MKKLEDICKVRVKFSEIDSMRVAWHGSYVAYLEDGRESFGRHFPGIGYDVISASGIYSPVYDLHIKYLAPLGLDDVAVIHTKYVYKIGARLDYKYEIYRERDNKLCIKASTTQLFIDAEGNMLLDMPDYYREWKKKYLGVEE